MGWRLVIESNALGIEHGGNGVTLEEVVKRHPLTGGLSELLAYFVLAENDMYAGRRKRKLKIPFEKNGRQRIAVTDEIVFLRSSAAPLIEGGGPRERQGE